MALIKLKTDLPGHALGGQGRPRRTCTRATRTRPLTAHQNKTGGRNNFGRITTRHHGGGSQQKYRLIDFKRDKDGIAGVVERLEYDPNRTAHIALVLYADGERRYILAPKGVKPGDEIRSGADAPIKPGNAMPLRHIPVGSHRAQHRAEARQGRPARAQRRQLGAVHRARRHVRDRAPEVRRDAQGARRLPRHDRRSRQRRAQPAQLRQGRRASAGAASARRCAASR